MAEHPDMGGLAPAEFDAELKEHYLGRVGLSLPGSLDLSYLSVNFSPPREGEAGPRISFHESPGTSHELPKLFKRSTEIKSFLGQVRLIGEEDLEIFSRPARLISHLTRDSVLDDLRLDLDLPPSPDKLEMDLAIREEWVLLEFSYERELRAEEMKDLKQLQAEAGNELLDWVRAFLPHYRWIGRNESPPANSLATRYGFITPPEGGDGLRANFYSSFEIIRAPEEKSSLDFLTLTARGFPDKSAKRPRPGRMVGGHLGEERKKISGLEEISDPIDPLDKEAILYLEWLDASTAVPTNFNPDYDIALYASATKEELGDLPYYLGLWDIMLNSVRLIK